MKSNKVYFFGLLVFIAIVIGFLAGKMYDVPGLTLDRKINPLHALSIIVTVFIAIVISIFFEKEKEKNKVIKEIIIRRIDKTIDLTESLIDLVATGKIRSEVVPGYPKRIHSSLKCSWSSFENNKIKTVVDFSELELIIRELKNLLTNTPINASGSLADAPISAKNGYFLYNEARVSEVSVELEKLKNMLFKAQLDVNMS